MTEYLAQPEEGGIPSHSLMMFATVCTDPSREQEFNLWYDAMHMVDILETEGFTTATRYQRVDAERGPGEPQSLALYEMSASDPMGPPTAMRPIMDRKRDCGRRVDAVERTHRAYLRRVL